MDNFDGDEWENGGLSEKGEGGMLRSLQEKEGRRRCRLFRQRMCKCQMHLGVGTCPHQQWPEAENSLKMGKIAELNIPPAAHGEFN